ncbi:MAG: hypothetical protein NTV04_17345, partial [Deltaproteobacteria bacterium]|nr:hypothetical protein [Deltaproteobacteria bacterium]
MNRMMCVGETVDGGGEQAMNTPTRDPRSTIIIDRWGSRIRRNVANSLDHFKVPGSVMTRQNDVEGGILRYARRSGKIMGGGDVYGARRCVANIFVVRGKAKYFLRSHIERQLQCDSEQP